jgi:hypothetical protein
MIYYAWIYPHENQGVLGATLWCLLGAFFSALFGVNSIGRKRKNTPRGFDVMVNRNK